MNRVITTPPIAPPDADGNVLGGWWHDEGDRIVCDLCPRECRLKPGDRGFCFVRENHDGQMKLTTYGRSTGFCIDPIEKKPLNHFYPGTSVLSFGTAGCNLGCKFCQNWSISKSREIQQLSQKASPAAIARAAAESNCRSVAFTYNDPVIWAEYAIDTARECHQRGVKTIAVTAGYITESARADFFQFIDAANVDLKAFTERFYQQLTLSHLQPVLETLVWLKRETDVWFEITNLVIPGENDEHDEFRRMCDWMVDHLGVDVPVHFTAFHPDFRMNDHPATPIELLLRAYDVARAAGIQFVYVGNVDDVQHQSTYCPGCRRLLIERNWYELGQYNLKEGCCDKCGHRIPGHFQPLPGSWGRKRLPVDISRYAASPPATDDSVTSQYPQQEATAMDAASSSPQRQKSGEVMRPELSPEQQVAVLRGVSEIVQAAVLKQPIALSDETLANSADTPVMGCFVSIKRKGRLRGCCGFLGRLDSLRRAIHESAVTSATGDVRMPGIVAEELPHLDFEIWLLYGRQPVTQSGEDRIRAVQIGRHGLQIQHQQRRGLLLPGVAVDHGFDAEKFLQQVCLKASLPPAAWKDDQAQLFTFEGLAVVGGFDASVISPSPTIEFRLTSNDIDRLAEFCRDNVIALARGAVPNYYLPEVTDCDVNGICVTLNVSGRDGEIQFARIVMRSPIPLQSSLFQVCEVAGRQLSDEGARNLRNDQIQIQLAILYDPAMQGSIAAPDLDGLDSSRRAILVRQGTRSAWRFDPQQTPDELLATILKDAEITLPEQAAIYSLVTQSNHTPMQVIQVPQSVSGPSVRPPAVANMFYPGSAEQLNQLLDELTPTEPATKEPWRAALVPHAGLIYSGRIAADVLRRIKMPRTIIVMGPKHTSQGVEWAVAPHATWSLPGITIAADKDLAAELCDSIQGLQLDASAHQREHAIEVELPWLARWAPGSRVTGIAIGNTSLDLCHQFASGLANVLKDRLDDTLLLISSDMNHFANDSETRRVDAMAIEAMLALDPDRLYHTVRDHHISMCGMLPACMVLESLRRLDKLTEAKRVSYGTSGDVSGDKSRVVGYAGMLFR